MYDRIRITAAAAALVFLAAAPAGAQPPAAAPVAPAGALTPEQVQAMMDPAVEENLRAVSAAIPGSSTVRTLRGRLAPSGKLAFAIDVEEGLYYIAGVCDEACGDIDLRMLAPDGRVVFADEGADKFPLTQASVTGRVTFNVELIMKACTKDPCAYGVRIFRGAAQTGG